MSTIARALGRRAVPLGARGDGRVAIRFIAVGVLIPLYYLLELTGLSRALRGVVCGSLGLLGHRAAAVDLGEGLYVEVGSSGFYEIGANCTYVDLVLVLAPFFWCFGRSLGLNLVRLGWMAGAVFTINLARVTLAIHFHQQGASWGLAHAFPDLSIHAAAIATAVFLAVRWDYDLA